MTLLFADHADYLFVVFKVTTIEDFLDLFDALGKEAAYSTMLSAAIFAELPLGFSALADDVTEFEASKAHYFLRAFFEWML